MTTDQAARILGVHRNSLWRWIAAGKVRGPKHILPQRKQKYWTAAEIERVRIMRSRNVRKPGNQPGSRRKRFDARAIAKMRSKGLSWARVGDRVGAAVSTLRKRFPRPQILQGTISTREVAAQLKCSRAALYGWLKRGLIPAPAPLSPCHPLLRWTTADVAAAKRARRLIPRPGGVRPFKVVDVRQIARLRAARTPWRTVARQVGCCIPTARRALLRGPN